jgi:hypothetical protein
MPDHSSSSCLTPGTFFRVASHCAAGALGLAAACDCAFERRVEAVAGVVGQRSLGHLHHRRLTGLHLVDEPLPVGFALELEAGDRAGAAVARPIAAVLLGDVAQARELVRLYAVAELGDVQRNPLLGVRRLGQLQPRPDGLGLAVLADDRKVIFAALDGFEERLARVLVVEQEARAGGIVAASSASEAGDARELAAANEPRLGNP